MDLSIQTPEETRIWGEFLLGPDVVFHQILAEALKEKVCSPEIYILVLNICNKMQQAIKLITVVPLEGLQLHDFCVTFPFKLRPLSEKMALNLAKKNSAH